MNVDEAPDKIYIQSFNSDEENTVYFDAIWTEEPESGQENIEYTRTDAFIEKACDYLQKNLWRTVLEEGEFRQRFVTDFKIYMKGE